MRQKLIQSTGIVWTLVYASFIVWLYAVEPHSFQEVATGAEVAVGAYQVDPQKFESGLALFHRDEFRAARTEWQQADPAARDARTQFYLAYAYYREGWGRVYNDQALFKQGLEAVNRALDLSRGASLMVTDPNLKMHTPAELKAELEQGLERGWSDFNPLKVLRTRK